MFHTKKVTSLALATVTSLGDEGYVVNEYVQVMK